MGINIEKPWALKKLKPLPNIATELMRLVTGDDVVFKRVAELVRSDPAFSAEVLRLANSPLLGASRSITSVLHALAMLGLDRLKSIVMAVALRDYLHNTLDVPALRRCWRHSLATAFVCERLAAGTPLFRDASYTAGLLHDIGRLSLLAAHPSDYARLIEFSTGSACGLLDCEKAMFGVDHCELGGWLVKEWMFPEEFLAYTTEHHQEPSTQSFDQLTVVQLSCRLADSLGFQVCDHELGQTFDELCAVLPRTVQSQLPGAPEMAAETAGKINALECALLC